METIAGFSKLSAAGVAVSVGAVLAHRAVTTAVRCDDEKWEAYMGLFDCWKYDRRAFEGVHEAANAGGIGGLADLSPTDEGFTRLELTRVVCHWDSCGG